MRPVVIIPTYDEKDNVRPIAEAVFRHAPDAHVLFVDDNSPDGTGGIVDALAAVNPAVHVIHQPGKGGLGRAYLAGFRWALARRYDLMFEMDADFSHDPAELPAFLRAAADADLVLGSRYMNGIRITNWPMSRLLLSKGASLYVRVITGMPVTDPTGGFKCFRREVLEALDLNAVLSNGYSFQVEMSHLAWMSGFRIVEIPITFVDRRAGYSKMNTRIAREAFWLVCRIALRNGFRRRPRKRRGPPAATGSEPRL